MGVVVVDDEELEVIVERSAGLDVHKDMVAVTVRVPGPDGGVVKHQAEFATFTEELCGLRDWLVALGGDPGGDGGHRGLLEAGVLRA